MMRIEGNKLVALLISAGMATTFLAACSINTDKLGEGISELGNAFTTESETEATKSETTEAPTELTTTTVTEETTEAIPTPSATPSPTPLLQRVDYSNYTDIDLNDTFTVSSEAFSESSYVDNTEILLAKFEGNRFVVTKAANENVMNSINLIINGFYNEAAGAYNRVYSKAKAEYDLKGSIEAPYDVLVDFKYTTNGRALSVLMVYEVSGGEADKTTVIDFASFDMISGQYITFNSVCKDPKGLAAVNTPEADDFDAVYLAPGPATTDAARNSFATLYGVIDGKVYSAVIDMNAYANFLNRYGASLFIA